MSFIPCWISGRPPVPVPSAPLLPPRHSSPSPGLAACDGDDSDGDDSDDDATTDGEPAVTTDESGVTVDSGNVVDVPGVPGP
ncbi:hypothetical protein [Corynebacterium sp.]|uniref:hypothetical protein n=1 Tax=Corynebacterium sp. TaxID=1720 RepID=UPI0025C6799C|nr:hypothetical protein [Corynebacterium sp.]